QSIINQFDQISLLAQKYKDMQNCLYLGRKYCSPIAYEGALKLKEISYIHAEGYAAGEMKHGPIALIDSNFVSVVLCPKDSVYEKTISNIEELKARGGSIIAVTTEGNDSIKQVADDIIYIPKTLEMLTPILAVVPLQIFAYAIATARGYDPDMPRNLAKAVTVE
ncbi:MAG: SIS domain-containing protein, partial [Candidatus Uhrbacteria bacterium]